MQAPRQQQQISLADLQMQDMGAQLGQKAAEAAEARSRALFLQQQLQMAQQEIAKLKDQVKELGGEVDEPEPEGLEDVEGEESPS